MRIYLMPIGRPQQSFSRIRRSVNGSEDETPSNGWDTGGASWSDVSQAFVRYKHVRTETEFAQCSLAERWAPRVIVKAITE